MKFINLVKGFSFAIALSALVLSSCKPDENPAPEAGTIEVTPASLQLDFLAQEKNVTVTSSEDWTLVGEYDWVTPSTVSGKTGEAVTFTTTLNTTGKARSASFTFEVTGSEAELIIRQSAGKIAISLEMEAVSAGDTDVNLTLDVASDNISLFNKWGVIYSKTDNKEEGDVFEIEGTPAAGTKEVTVTGLETNVKYYFWGYAEDVTGERFYTETPVEKTTGTATPDPDPTPTPPSEDGTPAHFAEMANNSIAITWANESAVNNLTAITMETLFRWDAFNKAGDGVETLFGVEGGWLVRCMDDLHWIPEDGWYLVTPTAGNLCFAPFVRDSGKQITDWKGMTQGVWHHLAITYDSATGAMAVYIDGTATFTGTFNIGTVNLLQQGETDSPNTFHIGKSYNENRWFNGALSEVRIWGRALSASEIAAEGHFYSVDPATAQNLIAYWKLDGKGTHVQDYSGNGHHGTAAVAF